MERWLDKIESRWSLALQIVGGLTYFGLPAWAASQTAYMKALGWLGVVGAGLFSLTLGVLAYLALQIANKVRLQTVYAKSSIAESGTNPLALEYRNETVSLLGFFDPYYVPKRGRSFTNCRMVGPAMLYAEQMVMNRCQFVNCQIVVVREGVDHIGGAVGLFEANMVGCEIVDVTFLMNRQTFDLFRREVPNADQLLRVIAG